MPIVINDFEVVSEPPPAPAPEPSAAAEPAPADPVALQRLLAELHEIALRTWSH